MGNCFSRGGRRQNGSASGGGGRASSNARRETTEIAGDATASSSTSRRPTIPTTGNKPFKPRRDGTWSSPVPMTRSQLHQQRTEFWETAAQYDGQVETWNSLRVAVELSHQNELATAQAVLDSAGITIPTGDLGLGCYDERGHRFVVPEYALSEPSNIVDDVVEIQPRDSSSTAVMKREIEDSESVDEAEKSYTVKVRLSTNAKDIGVPFKGNETVMDVKKRLMEQVGLKSDVKLFMFGKPLREDTALLKQGWDNHIIQGFVRE